jgi:hypothetical protein
VIDMPQSNQMFARCLKEWGYFPENITLQINKIRLLHDLYIWGDDAWDILEFLHRKLGVDFSNFPFDKYFPSEFSREGNSLVSRELLSLIGLKLNIVLTLRKYPEITIGMMEETIKNKRWLFD